jgi:hypothetical protein
MALSTDCLDLLSREAEVPRNEVADILEGFRDYISLNISGDAKAQLEGLRSRYTTRLNKSERVLRTLAEAKAAIEELIADGHPELPEAVVGSKVIEELDRNRDTMQAARRRFMPRPVTTGGRLVEGRQVPSDF